MNRRSPLMVENMAFNGYLMEMGGQKFPHKYIYKESYKVTPSARLDLDPFRNTEGWLMRNVLEHTATKISFQVKPMWNVEHAQMWAFLRSHYVTPHERKLRIVYYRPDTDDYAGGDFYIPDFTPQMDLVDEAHNRILFLSYELSFIEY